MLGVHSDRSTTLLVPAPLLGFVLWLIARLAMRAFRNLPPGPKGLPIIGDILHIADQDWLASPKRKDEYGESVTFTLNASRNPLMFLSRPGEMMYVSALGQGFLVINSQRVAVDLLEKRSNIYSDRRHYIAAGEFATRNLPLSMTPYGDLYAIDSLTFTHADFS
jgi:hypothetical protein